MTVSSYGPIVAIIGFVILLSSIPFFIKPSLFQSWSIARVKWDLSLLGVNASNYKPNRWFYIRRRFTAFIMILIGIAFLIAGIGQTQYDASAQQRDSDITYMQNVLSFSWKNDSIFVKNNTNSPVTVDMKICYGAGSYVQLLGQFPTSWINTFSINQPVTDLYTKVITLKGDSELNLNLKLNDTIKSIYGNDVDNPYHYADYFYCNNISLTQNPKTYTSSGVNFSSGVTFTLNK